ncbi:MAG: SDR family NAD(P)-dependent oxidoreductase [Saprospiraceae bacterium]
MKISFSKKVMITGATSGIGNANAKIFAKNGFNLIITGRRKEKLDELKKKLTNKYSIHIISLCFDIRNQAEVKKAWKSLKPEWKQLDILINNAGLAKGFQPIHEGNSDDWEVMIDTNVKGLLYITRLVSQEMVKNKKGHIINLCSSAGHEVYPNGNVYCATKFAVDALTKSMRLDLYKFGIRVSQVSPGHVEETEFALVRFDGDENKAKIYEDFTPLKSKDVAEIIYFVGTRQKHINIQDILVMGTQQASNNYIDRSGRLIN